MPPIDAAAFQAEAKRINPHLGRFKKSTLDPIFKLVGSHSRLTLAPDLHDEVQELIHFLPSAAMRKYASALRILEAGGLRICGRPCAPSMHFVYFRQADYNYVGLTGDGGQKMATVSPGCLCHTFDLKWKSSTGEMQDLTEVYTREHVKFRTSQTNPPFNDINSTTMEFYWGEGKNGNDGYGRDDHMTKPPALICREPFTAGVCIADQKYQYSLDNVTWKPIPGAAYQLHKGVRQSGGRWVYYLRKCNWAPFNTVGYNFEAEYPLDPLVSRPKAGQAFMKAYTSPKPLEINDFGRLVSRH